MLHSNTKVHLKKYDIKAQKRIVFGYSKRSKHTILYNFEIKKVEESIHVKFDDNESGDEKSKQVKNFVDTEIIV